MRRRRFFRVLTLTLLLLCLGAWGWSYRYGDAIIYQGDTRSGISLFRGGVHFFHGPRDRASRAMSQTDGLERIHVRQIAGQMSEGDTSGRVLGFQFRPGRNTNLRYFIRIPMWFPTLLLTALTAWAWRKRRSEGERGFAVGEDLVREARGAERAADRH